MWGYIKKIIEYIVFSFLVEGVVVVARLSFDGIMDGVAEVFKLAIYIAPGVMAALTVLSLIKLHRKRIRVKYEKDPISTKAIVILSIVGVIGSIAAAVGANLLTHYLYSI